MNSKTTRRLFVGMPFPGMVRANLHHDVAALANTVPERSVKWVPEANLHLTLKFLGEVDEERVDHLIRGLTENFLAWGAIEVVLHEVVVLFPGTRCPRVVVAGVEGGDRLLRLAECLEFWAENEGFRRTRRGFRPHITLGRVRRGCGPFPELVEACITPLTFTMDRVSLYESRLTERGARYIVCHSVALAT